MILMGKSMVSGRFSQQNQSIDTPMVATAKTPPAIAAFAADAAPAWSRPGDLARSKRDPSSVGLTDR